jgi:hypothetical protein
MGSRLLPLALAACALLADGVGLHRGASYLVLLAVPAAAAAAFIGVADVLEGKAAWTRGIATSLALVLLVVGSASRMGAAAGAGVPHIAVSAAIAAVLVYTLPVVGWLFEPLATRRRTPAPARAAAPVSHAEAA